MKKTIKLIGLDLDGTTLDDNKEIRPRVKAAIQKAIQKGIIVMPATGRQLSGIPEEFLSIPGVRYALTANGAMVYDLQEEKELYTDYFPKEIALSMIEYLSDKDILITMYQGGRGYTSNLDFTGYEEIVSPKMLEYMKSTREEVSSLKEVVENDEDKIEKFSILFKDAQLRAKTLEELHARKDNCTTSSIHMNLEINTITANKGDGLIELGKKLGISREEIMAIGDGGNDAEMINAVGFGVAMGNASEDLKQMADYVTASYTEDGVAVAIEKILAE